MGQSFLIASWFRWRPWLSSSPVVPRPHRSYGSRRRCLPPVSSMRPNPAQGSGISMPRCSPPSGSRQRRTSSAGRRPSSARSPLSPSGSPPGGTARCRTGAIRRSPRSIGFQNGKDSHTIGKKRNVIYCIYGIYGFSYLVRYLVNSHSFNDILLHICCASRRKVLILRL